MEETASILSGERSRAEETAFGLSPKRIEAEASAFRLSGESTHADETAGIALRRERRCGRDRFVPVYARSAAALWQGDRHDEAMVRLQSTAAEYATYMTLPDKPSGTTAIVT